MIDQELKQRALNPAAKDETAPREKILKLGKKITDVVEHKLGKLNASDAEYWGLAGVVTDEMADIALSMKLRTPYTVEELWRTNKVTDEQKPHFQELLDQMSYIGLLEYDYGYHYDHNGRTAPQSERRYILPMFVPGSAELFNMEEDADLSGRNPRLEQHPELAKFFERMTYVPLAGKTHLLPPGGGVRPHQTLVHHVRLGQVPAGGRGILPLQGGAAAPQGLQQHLRPHALHS